MFGKLWNSALDRWIPACCWHWFPLMSPYLTRQAQTLSACMFTVDMSVFESWAGASPVVHLSPSPTLAALLLIFSRAAAPDLPSLWGDEFDSPNSSDVPGSSAPTHRLTFCTVVHCRCCSEANQSLCFHLITTTPLPGSLVLRLSLRRCHGRVSGVLPADQSSRIGAVGCCELQYLVIPGIKATCKTENQLKLQKNFPDA